MHYYDIYCRINMFHFMCKIFAYVMFTQVSDERTSTTNGEEQEIEETIQYNRLLQLRPLFRSWWGGDDARMIAS